MSNREMELAEIDDGKSDRSSKPASQDEFVLEQVLGLTSTSMHALACNPLTGAVAFPAACMLVILDPKSGEQKFIESPSLRYITCVCFSDDGLLVAFGENGAKPYISVWLTKEHKEFSTFVVDKSVGIKSVVLHPKSSFMAILGVHELTIEIWDYIRGRRLALSKWQTVPLSITIPKLGSCVIVCGHRKITLFNIENVNSHSYETNVFEDRKAVLLGRQSEYTFVDIASGKGRHDKMVYTITTCGYLCQIMLGDILIDKATKVDAHSYCVRYGMDHVFVGCCEGVVKICHPENLNVTAAVSLSHLLGPEALPKVGSKLYVDTTAIALNDKDSIVTCIYADGNMHSWQINSLRDTIECSAILPQSKKQSNGSDHESTISDHAYKASLLRSFIGCCEKVKDTVMFDPFSLAFKPRRHGHQAAIHQMNDKVVRFSPDGKDVVCGNEDGEIKVYEAASGTLRRVIEAHSSHVTCIEFMYDNTFQLLATGGRDRIIFVLDAKNDFSLVQVLCDHSAAITAVSLVHNGGALTLVSAAADNVILVRKAIVGSTLKFTITGEIAEAKSNKSFYITNDYIVTGARNGNIKLFRADPVFSGKAAKTIKCPNKSQLNSNSFKAIDIDPSGTFLATTQNPGHVTVYHLQTGQPVASLSSQSDVHYVKFTSDLKYIVSSTSHGCTLVWRLPERMTDFMKSKQEKLYQIEMAREISYETYVSCVRLCNELESDESTITANDKEHASNSNHNSDRDVTPSIESLSLLKMCRTGSSDPDRQSACNSESFISCSTCTESYTDTIDSGQTTDSSVQICSAPVRFYCGNDDRIFGKLVEERQCVKLGPFKNKSFDKMTEEQEPKSEVGDTTVKLEISDTKNDTVNESGKSKPREKLTKRTSNSEQASSLDAIKSPETSTPRKSPDGTKVIRENVSLEETATGRKKDVRIKIDSKSPLCANETFSPPSAKSPESFLTANSPTSPRSKDTSFTPNDNAYFSPLCNTSDGEEFERVSKSSPPKAFDQVNLQYGMKAGSPPRAEIQLEEGLSRLTTPKNLNTLKASNQPSVAVLPKISPCESQWGDSLFRDLQKAYEAEINQGVSVSPKIMQSELEDCRRLLTGSCDTHMAETNLKPESAVTKDSGFQFTASNGTLCDSSYIIDVDKESNKIPSKSIVNGSSGEASDLKKQPRSRTSEEKVKNPFECVDEGEVYNYHSITRDEHGRLRRVYGGGESTMTSPEGDGLAENFASSSPKHEERSGESDTLNLDKSPSIWHIQCSRCAHRGDSKTSCLLTSALGDCKKTGTLSLSPHVKKRQCNDDDNKSNSRELDSDEALLNEYYSDLRSCLHLSNSQETFNQLKCDIDDDELMRYLSDVLLNKPEEFAEMFSLSLCDIQKLQRMNLFESIDKACPCLLKELCRSSNGNLEMKREKNTLDASVIQTKTNPVEIFGNKWKTLDELVSKSKTKKRESTELDENNIKEMSAIFERLPNSDKPSPKTSSQSPPRSKTDCPVKKKRLQSGDRGVTRLGKVTESVNSNELCTDASNECLSKSCFTCGTGMPRTIESQQTATEYISTQSIHSELLTAESSLNSCGRNAHLRTEPSSSKAEDEKKKCVGLAAKSRSPRHRISQLVSRSNNTSYASDSLHLTRSPEIFQRPQSPPKVTLNRSPLGPQLVGNEKQTFKETDALQKKKLVLSNSEKDGMEDKKGRRLEEAESGTDTSQTLKVLTPPLTNTEPDSFSESQTSVEPSQTRDRKYSQSFAEMFRDQDDYLKKLKEVREKFEMSIQALSNERKSRLAEEEKSLHNK